MSVIGVDFGGTRIKAGIVTGGNVTELRIMSVPADRLLAGILDRLEELFHDLIDQSETPVNALAWAMPCVVASDGRTISRTFGKYDDCATLPLFDWARERFALPLFLENDARAAAIGEWRYGAGRGTSNMVAITLGTGIGSAAIVDGRPLSGAGGFAGNLGGHLRIPGANRPCICGLRGCVEAEAATWALPEIARESPLFADSPLSTAERIDYLAVFELAAAGDTLSIEMRDRAIEAWAFTISEMARLYDPQLTVLGGGIMAGAETILPRLRDQLGEGFPIAAAELGDAAALAGAGDLTIVSPSMTSSENQIHEQPTDPLICSGCGREAAVVIDGSGWCVDCWHERGSCCSGE